MPSELERNLINRVALGDFLRRRARATPDAVALVDYNCTPPVRMTYGALNARANRFARLLRTLGASKGDRIVLLAPNCIDGACVMYGCFKAGLVYVPLNVAMGNDDLAYVFGHASPAVALVHPALADRWAGICASLIAAPQAVVLGSDSQADMRAADSLLATQSPAEVLDVLIEDRDRAQIMYTSGTTARPKGAVHTHLSMVLWTLSMALAFGLRPGASHACPLPFFHIGGQSHMLTYHHVGGKYVFRDFDAAAYADLIEAEQIQGLFLLPMMWKALLELPDIETRDFGCVERALYAMAPMPADLLGRLKKIFGCTFDQASGQTETSIMTQFLDGAESEFSGRNYWGTPITTADQAVLGSDGQELPQGEVGEICWRGPTIMSGYYEDDGATAAASEAGWHHSGDLGLIDREGQLLFVDRKKDMIKSGGENVSSVRVEQVILGVPGVRQAAVVGIAHPKWGEAVVACVTAEAAGVCADTILETCRAVLSRYEVPKHVELMQALPVTPTGKVLKPELRERLSGLFATDYAT